MQEYTSAGLDAFDCQADIEKYLLHHLSHPPSEIVDTLPRRWLKDSETVHDVRTLAKDCGGFFIYAAMTHSFIFDDRVRNPPKQLKVLGRSQVRSTKSVHALDDRYLRVLKGAVSEYSAEDDVRRIQQTIATMILIRKPIPMSVFAEFFCASRSTKFAMRCITCIPSS